MSNISEELKLRKVSDELPESDSDVIMVWQEERAVMQGRYCGEKSSLRGFAVFSPKMRCFVGKIGVSHWCYVDEFFAGIKAMERDLEACRGGEIDEALRGTVRAVVDAWVSPLAPRDQAADEIVEAIRPYLRSSPPSPPSSTQEVVKAFKSLDLERITVEGTVAIAKWDRLLNAIAAQQEPQEIGEKEA